MPSIAKLKIDTIALLKSKYLLSHSLFLECRMAFKFKTPKSLNKILAGAGIVALLGAVGSMAAPGFMNSTLGKAVEGVAAYSIGGIESVVGAVATMFIANKTTSTAEVNTLTESL